MSITSCHYRFQRPSLRLTQSRTCVFPMSRNGILENEPQVHHHRFYHHKLPRTAGPLPPPIVVVAHRSHCHRHPHSTGIVGRRGLHGLVNRRNGYMHSLDHGNSSVEGMNDPAYILVCESLSNHSCRHQCSAPSFIQPTFRNKISVVRWDLCCAGRGGDFVMYSYLFRCGLRFC